MQERKKIEGHDGKYSIDIYGVVMNDFTNKELAQCEQGFGYLTVTLNRTKMYVHRLVAITFIPNTENKPQVNHKDLNKTNNHVSNLEWMTSKENLRHYHSSDLAKQRVGNNMQNKRSIFCLGENHGRHKVTNDNVLEIRSCELSRKDLASKFQISQMAVSKILRRITWKHI